MLGNVMIMCKMTVNTYINQVILTRKIISSSVRSLYQILQQRMDFDVWQTRQGEGLFAMSNFLCFFLRLERTSSLPLIHFASATFPRASTLSWPALTSRLHSTLRMVCGSAPLASRIPGSGPAMWSQTQILWWVLKKGSAKDVCDCMKC